MHACGSDITRSMDVLPLLAASAWSASNLEAGKQAWGIPLRRLPGRLSAASFNESGVLKVSSAVQSLVDYLHGDRCIQSALMSATFGRTLLKCTKACSCIRCSCAAATRTPGTNASKLCRTACRYRAAHHQRCWLLPASLRLQALTQHSQSRSLTLPASTDSSSIHSWANAATLPVSIPHSTSSLTPLKPLLTPPSGTPSHPTPHRSAHS